MLLVLSTLTIVSAITSHSVIVVVMLFLHEGENKHQTRAFFHEVCATPENALPRQSTARAISRLNQSIHTQASSYAVPLFYLCVKKQ